MPVKATAEACKAWIAKVASAQGNVQARRASEMQWTAVQRHDTFCSGAIIRVGPRSRAAIVAYNDAVYRLDENTTVTITAPKAEQSFWLSLKSGAAYFFSRAPRSLRVITPFANAGVEGTEFVVKVEHDQTTLSVFQGRVLASNAAGSLALASDQSAIVKAGRAPSRYVALRPRDTVQWALHYPAIVDFHPSDFPGATAWQAAMRQSISFYEQGDLTRAFDSIADAPQTIDDPRFFIYRATLRLTVGRVEKARIDIDRALELDSRNGHAYALQSMIAVTQNRKDDALQEARKATELSPASSAAWVALSYAQQAYFDLEGALASLKKAVLLPPENALAWARLAELWLSVGNLKRALDAAQRAVALKPQVERTHTVLGFAFLTQSKMQQAKHAFEHAMERDQAAPLPRLGLGLTQIRQGELQAGRGAIEIAVSLDPDNALIRSYLGKSYYEEKRDKLAMEQYDAAKGIDPLDPTAFFYDAIRQQSVNQPVESLRELQTSIKLNDNRAVYRSRLLLDSDLGARSATLARIYHDLGFQQRALVEGWQALNVDPSNYSAHRFLSDSYAALPRHEIARVSELLQSQLLQPLTITPVQPQLAESALRLVSGSGPSDPSTNEFHPLFNRDRVGLLASGVVGNHNTWGDELVLSGVADSLTYSIGQFHYETNGFRENNDLEQNIYNMFVQARLSYGTSIQAEFRYEDSKAGDLPLRSDTKNFSSTLRQNNSSQSVRLGLHHAFTPYSDIIASFIYRSADINTEVFPGFDLITDDDSYLGEIQHLYRSKRFHVISGIGYFGADRKNAIRFPPLPATISEPYLRHINLYTYVQIHYPQHITWTIGGSADFIESATIDRDQFNPKFGLIWRLFPTTTLRASIFRNAKRMLISNQTLEPTQVAGFNQFFDDVDSTDAWRYSIGLDQKFSPVIYGGIEFSRRELDVPFTALSSEGRVREADWDEDLARAYLYWTPHSWLALSMEYQYERFDRGPSPAFGEEGIVEVQTHRLPLGVRFFHPSGFSAQLKTTYIDQNGKFENVLSGEIMPGDDQFWVVDAAIQYRLPKRWGIVTIEASNLFDQGVHFQDTDPENPSISPERLIWTRFTLAY